METLKAFGRETNVGIFRQQSTEIPLRIFAYESQRRLRRRGLDRRPAVRVGKVFEEQCPKMTNPVGPNFIQRQLDPASALGEVLFGLIMVLTTTTTLTAGLTAAEDPEGVAILLGG